MTKFILHGGSTRTPSVHNDNFYKEMFKASKKKPILVCYCSRPYKEWDWLLESEQERFGKAVGNKEYEFLIASKDPKIFLDQMKEVNVVYFRGGSTRRLMKRLETVKGKLKKAFNGKTVLGSSAGAIFLAKYYYDQDDQDVFKGFNIIPAKIITHYLSDGEYAAVSGKEKLEMLKSYKEKLPVYAIKETEFKIVKL